MESACVTLVVLLFVPVCGAQNYVKLASPDRLSCVATAQSVLLVGPNAAKWKVESKGTDIKDGAPFAGGDRREYFLSLKPNGGACADSVVLTITGAGAVRQEVTVPIAKPASTVPPVPARVESVTTYLCNVSTEILIGGDGIIAGSTVHLEGSELLVTLLRPGLLSARIPAGVINCGAKTATASLSVPNQKALEFAIPVMQNQASGSGIGLTLALGFLLTLLSLGVYHRLTRRVEEAEEDFPLPVSAADPNLQPVTRAQLRNVENQIGDQNRKLWEAVNKLSVPKKPAGQPPQPQPSMYSPPYREPEDPPPPPLPPPPNKIQQFIDDYNCALDDNQLRKAFRQSWGSRSVAIANQNERRGNAQLPPIFGDAAEGDFWVIPAQGIESRLTADRFILVPIAGSWGSQRILDGAWDYFFDFEDPRTRQLARLQRPAVVAKDGPNWTCLEKGRLL